MLPKNLIIISYIGKHFGLTVRDLTVRNSLGVETTLKQFIPVNPNQNYTLQQVQDLVYIFGGAWDSANGVYTYTVDCDDMEGDKNVN